MSRRSEPAATLEALSRHRCDTLITVPIVLARLLDAYSQSPDNYDLSALRVVAVSGSPLSAELGTRAMDLLGDVVYNLYGSTEVAYATIATPADLRAAPGTVGRPPYGTTVAILDAHGHHVVRGLPGRVFVGNAVHFGGYTDGATKETIAGLMSTGDVGHFDDQARLFIDGRDDDMIVSGGENVYPAEVEAVLHEHPGVADVAVVGVPDERWGEVGVAFVVADGVSCDELLEWCAGRLARFKVPKSVRFIGEIPRNGMGKVQKQELRETEVAP
jgi:fatty-acyl-CoA synthase